MIALLDRAIEFAARAHDGQRRKSDRTPYIAHPFAVALILQRMDCPLEVVIAGLLHDTVEDTRVSIEEIEANFGQTVAEIVAGCTEPSKRLSWEARKSHSIEYFRTAPLPVKLVAAADKFHNLTATQRIQQSAGPAVWNRFRRGIEQQAWYYRNVTASLVANVSEPERYPLFAELEELVNQAFAGVIPQAPDGQPS
jgi:(p)ppGpp synthase/HD superfamily hydrolase